MMNDTPPPLNIDPGLENRLLQAKIEKYERLMRNVIEADTAEQLEIARGAMERKLNE